MTYAGNIMSLVINIYFILEMFLSGGNQQGQPQLNYIVSQTSSQKSSIPLYSSYDSNKILFCTGQLKPPTPFKYSG